MTTEKRQPPCAKCGEPTEPGTLPLYVCKGCDQRVKLCRNCDGLASLIVAQNVVYTFKLTHQCEG